MNSEIMPFWCICFLIKKNYENLRVLIFRCEFNAAKKKINLPDFSDGPL